MVRTLPTHNARDQAAALFWPLMALTLGWWLYLHPATAGFTAVPGDVGDARFNSVILEHVYRWLVGLEADLWSPRFFYPFEGALAFSDNHFGSILPYALARWSGLGREVAFDVWFVTGTVLNLACAHHVSRVMGLSPLAAATSAFLYTFALPALAQDGHAQLTYRFAVPLAVLSYWRLRTQPDVNHLSWLVIWWAVQFLCSIYLGLFLTLLLIFLLAVSWRARHMKATVAALRNAVWIGQSGRKRAVLLALALLSLVLLALMLNEYRSIAGAYQFKRPRSEIRSMLPRLGSYLLADRSALSRGLGPWIQGIPMRHEHQLSLGLGGWMLVAVGVFAARRPSAPDWARPMMMSGLWLGVFTLSVAGASLYDAVIYSPGFNAVRAVTRVCLVMLWPAALLAGLAVQRVQQADTRPFAMRHGAACLLASLAVLDLPFTAPNNTPIATWQARQQSMADQFDAMSPPHDPIVLARPLPGDLPLHAELDAMIFAQDRGLRTLNGYSGNMPPGYHELDGCTAPDQRLLAYARFKQRPPSTVEPWARRVIEFNRRPCPSGS